MVPEICLKGLIKLTTDWVYKEWAPRNIFELQDSRPDLFSPEEDE